MVCLISTFTPKLCPRYWVGYGGGGMKSTNLSILPLQLGAARMDILATKDQVVLKKMMLTDDGQYLQCICEKVLPGVQCQFWYYSANLGIFRYLHQLPTLRRNLLRTLLYDDEVKFPVLQYWRTGTQHSTARAFVCLNRDRSSEVTWGLGFCGLIPRTNWFKHPLQRAKGTEDLF